MWVEVKENGSMVVEWYPQVSERANESPWMRLKRVVAAEMCGVWSRW